MKEKIAVIICVNDERRFAECQLYLEQQYLSPEYELEIIDIRGAASIFSGYEYARGRYNNRYKLYMHQDTFLTHKQCVQKMLTLFQQEPSIGMLGLVGSASIPPSGIWWERDKNTQYGHVVQGGDVPEYLEVINGMSMAKPYQEVAAIDGFFMMTQYDLPWRSDLFSGWHFYDVSQSVEYKRQGYKLAIPYAEEAWAFHDCGRIELDDTYEKERQIFIHEYIR